MCKAHIDIERLCSTFMWPDMILVEQICGKKRPAKNKMTRKSLANPEKICVENGIKCQICLRNVCGYISFLSVFFCSVLDYGIRMANAVRISIERKKDREDDTEKEREKERETMH